MTTPALVHDLARLADRLRDAAKLMAEEAITRQADWHERAEALHLVAAVMDHWRQDVEQAG